MKITDKMRLDWLNGEVGFKWSYGVTSHSKDRYRFSGSQDVFAHDIRRAIDAAIRAAKKPKRKGVGRNG